MLRRLRKSETNRTSLSRRLREIRRNERNSGSLRLEAACKPKNVSAGIGPVEAGESDQRREWARKRGQGPETGGQRIPVRGRHDRRNFEISGSLCAFTKHLYLSMGGTGRGWRWVGLAKVLGKTNIILEFCRTQARCLTLDYSRLHSLRI